MLSNFILRAKSACYVADGTAVLPTRPSAHDLTFQDGELLYRDSYFGGTDFIGQEVVQRADAAIWSMNYRGEILRADLLTSDEGGEVSKSALATRYQSGRFLGGSRQTVGLFDHHNENEGDWRSFVGVEWTVRDSELACRLDCHGGLIRA